MSVSIGLFTVVLFYRTAIVLYFVVVDLLFLSVFVGLRFGIWQKIGEKKEFWRVVEGVGVVL